MMQHNGDWAYGFFLSLLALRLNCYYRLLVAYSNVEEQ